MTFTDQQCQQIVSPYRAFMKKKLRLTCSIPHTVLHSHLLYNLTNLNHRLIAAHSEALLFAIKDHNLLDISTKHRLKQLQQKEWLASSSLLCWPYTTPLKDSDWLANVLCKWNKSVITVQVPTTFHNIIKGGNILLHTLSYSHGRSMLTFANLSLQKLLSNPISSELNQKVPHLKECYFDFEQPNKISVASTSTFNNNENTPIEMEVEATSTSSPQDKGKGSEQIITPVKNTPIDLDQSFDAAENMLDNTQQKILFILNSTNKVKCNAACDMFNGIHFPSFTVPILDMDNTTFLPLDVTPIAKFTPEIISTQLVNISQQLADIHNQLGFTLTKVNTIETVLNITSISPEQADIINNNKYKNPLDDMEEEDNEVFTAGIDISNNLSDNYEKLNNALVAVAQMQRLLVHHEILSENRLINITELIKQHLQITLMLI
ncbi:20335_t:CDS:2, partial [Funneliformis geosporum]